MLENKYLDCTAQKAYIDGINGCVEHVTIVQEVIQHARLNSKTLHCTWFDLMDAFGSVPHALIPYVMKHYNFPNHIIKYITSLYSKLEGKVLTKDWESEPFKFLRGVFQGDPYSGIIFLCTVYDRCTVQLFQVGGVPEMSNPESDSVTLYLRNRYCTLHVALCSEWDKQWKSRRVVWRNFT